MSREVQGLLIQIEATTAQLRREMQAADQAVDKTRQKIERELAGVDSAFDRTAQKAQQAGSLIKGAFAAIAGAGIAGAIIKQVDAYGEMVDRMRMATGGAEEYELVQKRLMRTAQETYRPLREAQELYIQTADVIKGLGYNTQQTLDITDSFSFLLVTNSASADKASSALDAYSKSLQIGKVNAQSWSSIMTAMPTVVTAIADATGKTAQEVRRLGAEGKLSLDDLNNGYLKTVEVNREATESMRTTMGDAMVNIQNGVQDLLGRLNDSAGATTALVDAIGFVADNIDVLAALLGGAAVAGLALYSAKAAVATATTLKGIQAAITERAARRAQSDAILQVAIANQRAAQTAVHLAAMDAKAAQGTAVQTQMSLQLAQARQREAVATAAVTAAQTGLKTASAGLLSVMGGPVGLAMLVGSAAAAFFLMRSGSDDAAVGLNSLTMSVDEYAEAWVKAGVEQRRVLLDEARQGADAAKESISGLAKDILQQFDKASRDTWGGWSLTAEIIDGIEEMREAALSGEGDIDAMAQALLSLAPAGSGVREEVQRLVAELKEKSDRIALLDQRMADYTDRINENTEAQRDNAAALDELGESAKKYLATLNKRIDEIWASGDPVKQALLHIKEYGKYTKEEADAILAAAHAEKEALAARKASNEALKQGKKDTKSYADEIKALTDKYNPAAKAQREYEKSVKLAGEQFRSGKMSLEEYQNVIQGLFADLQKPSWEKHNKAAADAKKRLKEVDDQLNSIRDRFDPLRAAQRKLAEEQRFLKKTLDEGGISLEEYSLRLAQLDEEYSRTEKAASQWGRWTESALERVDSAFADAWRNIGDGFKGFRDNLTNGFKQMLAELAHLAITKPIVMQIGGMLGIGQGTQGNNGIWGGLLGGAGAAAGGGSVVDGALDGATAGSGSSGGGSGSSLQTGLQYASLARNAYSLYTNGLGGIVSTMGGYMSTLGSWIGSSSLGSFGAGMQGAYLAPGLAGPTTAGSTGMMGLGSKLGSGMTAAWPLAVVAGMIMSGKLYDQGVRPSASEMWASTQGNTLGQIGNVASTFQSGKFKLIDSALEPIFGGKIAAMLSGSTFHQALWGGINKKLFGGAWKTKDYGLGLSVNDGEFGANKFEYRKKKGGLFSSSKKKTIWTQMEEETATALQEAYDATRTGVFDLFEALSYELDDGVLDGMKIATAQISTLGKTEEKIQEEIAAWFDKAAESINTELHGVLGTGLDYDLEGMQAFVGNLLGVNEMLRYLDVEMYTADVAGGKLAERLSELAGGFDALQSGTATYYENFFSAEEKIADTIDSITRAFESAEVELPDTREAYRSMVEDIDMTTEAGQQMFATLMTLSGHAATFFDIAEQKAADAIASMLSGTMGAASSAFALVQRSIGAERSRLTAEFNAAVQAEQAAAQRAASAASAAASARASSLSSMVTVSQELVRALSSLDKAMSSALERLRSTDSAVVAFRREQSVSMLHEALAWGRAGKSLAKFDGLEGALDVAATLDSGAFRTFEDFQREQGITSNLIADLQGINGKQLTTEEKLLEQLQKQYSAAQASASRVSSGFSGISAQLQADYDAAIAALDAELEAAQAQMDALNGIDHSILGVGVAVDRMSAAIVAAINAQQSAATGGGEISGDAATIKRLYESILGYTADAQGVKHWSERLGNGDTYADLVAALRWQAGQDALGKVPAFASGGFHGGGLRLVGENGPELEVTGPSRIYNSAQTAAMLSGGNSAAEIRQMTRVIAELQKTVAGQGDALRAIAKHTNQTARRVEILERWDFDGMPETREAV